MIRPQDLLCPKPEGLYCAPGDFYIDPVQPVARAVITHGHSDHARSGHGAVLATPETLAIMAERYGAELAGALPEATVLGFDDYAAIGDRLDDVLTGRPLVPHSPRDRRTLLPISPVARTASRPSATDTGSPASRSAATNRVCRSSSEGAIAVSLPGPVP